MPGISIYLSTDDISFIDGLAYDNHTNRSDIITQAVQLLKTRIEREQRRAEAEKKGA